MASLLHAARFSALDGPPANAVLANEVSTTKVAIASAFR
jgi:hypothetical protein